jgi:2,4-dienoyl-CoA reductase-like NADH-dependent reductase (Old Yellow Enzyme family)
MATYYRQRASAGLIISEATGISREGLGWPYAPGLWSEAQVEAWKPVTEAVHEAGGRVVAQLWHMGRVHPDLNDGKPPVSASATRPGHVHTFEGRKDAVEARPLRLDEMPRLLDDYARAAENAKKAGFDGVQLHGANGYLIDQFLRDSSNLRTDEYGGSPENRVRLLREVMERLIAVWGNDRVGVRLSPNGDSQGVDDSNPAAVFGLAAKELEKLKPAFVELRQPAGRHLRRHPGSAAGWPDPPALHRPAGAQQRLYPGTGRRRHRLGPRRRNQLWPPVHFQPGLGGAHRQGCPARAQQERARSWYFPVPEGYTDYPTLAEETV